ncbi:MAG: indole-3-glycerol phosphate synthase TrpC [Candidatus Caenarcaniphilales bacterium]|nr:indole-3-glycerol phosphate synthase TrpC [Candidatus Caenarcaniphilales bacterium]
MTKILEDIIDTKRKELADSPSLAALELVLKNQEMSEESFKSRFVEVFKKTYGPVLIAELKKASPSKGLIREDFEPIQLAEDYKSGGAHILSVLTDEQYFQGSLKYLSIVSKSSQLPTLRKDFIIDRRQILQAKIAGASAILLIASVLSDKEINILFSYAMSLGLNVLLEVHDETELKRALNTDISVIGINNRNLNNFEVDLKVSLDLLEKYSPLLKSKYVVSESGIYTSDDVKMLYDAGAKGFLVGESLMRQENLKQATFELLQGVV